MHILDIFQYISPPFESTSNFLRYSIWHPFMWKVNPISRGTLHEEIAWWSATVLVSQFRFWFCFAAGFAAAIWQLILGFEVAVGSLITSWWRQAQIEFPKTRDVLQCKVLTVVIIQEEVDGVCAIYIVPPIADWMPLIEDSSFRTQKGGLGVLAVADVEYLEKVELT